MGETGEWMLTIIIAVCIFAAIFFIVAEVFILPAIPSDELCQKYIDKGDIKSARNYWCEENLTGWHFNRTKMKEDLGGKLTI
jgi:hypothetical protein